MVFGWLFGKGKGELSKEEFADLYAEGLGRMGIAGELLYDSEQFSFQITNGDESMRISLSNAYEEYRRASKEEKEPTLAKYLAISARAMATKAETFDEIRANLLPVVRHRAQLSLTMLSLEVQNGSLTASFPEQLVGEHLSLGIGVDAETSFSQVADDTLAEWDVSMEDAFGLARQNIESLSADPWEQLGPGLYRSPWRDTYDGARIACPQIIERLHVEGDSVVLFPNRITALVTGSGSLEGLRQMLEEGEQAQEEDRPISLVPVIRKEGAWTSFRPEELYPELDRYRTLRLVELYQNYLQQKELLQELHETNGVDLFVATLMAVQDTETLAIVTTVTTWSEDVHTLLPEAEQICFVHGDLSEPTKVPWSEVERVAGALMRRTDHYPPRYETLGFPSAEMFHEMKPDQED